MTFLTIFSTIIAAAILGGGSAGLLGVFIIGLRMPFITVFAAHAALAGAVFGVLFGVNSSLSGFIGALLGVIILGVLLKNRKIDPNAALGTLFSLMLGIAFLGIGLNKGPKSPILSLLWGSLLFVTGHQLLLMAILAGLLICFVAVFYNDLKALMFSRELAALVIPEWLIFNLLLILSAGIITINLEIVGGLMLYSLISNPAVAAARLAHSFRQALVLSSFFGVLSALGGFLIAYWLNLPVGACIVLLSSMIVGVSFLIAN
ncbi:metal ABC transporter permease [Candidatus Latescibacterota bacterium]